MTRNNTKRQKNTIHNRLYRRDVTIKATLAHIILIACFHNIHIRQIYTTKRNFWAIKRRKLHEFFLYSSARKLVHKNSVTRNNMFEKCFYDQYFIVAFRAFFFSFSSITNYSKSTNMIFILLGVSRYTCRFYSLKGV